MDAEFAAADKVVVGQLDGMVEKLKSSQPAFYEEYQSARVIVDNASGIKKEQPQPQPANQ